MELFLGKQGGMKRLAVYAKYAVGYASTCAWAAILLFSPLFGSPSTEWAAVFSMFPGLVACLCSVLLFRLFPSIGGRTAFVTASAFLMALGTLLCTYPSLSHSAPARVAGLVLSGFFAIILVMSWFDAYSQLGSRGIVVLSGCAVGLAAAICWGALLCDSYVASVIESLLPMVSFVLLPSAGSDFGLGSDSGFGSFEVKAQADTADGFPQSGFAQSGFAQSCSVLPSAIAQSSNLTVRDIAGAAVPLRTLVGLGITFFIVSSIGSLAPEFSRFAENISPLSLLVPFGVTAFFIASAFFVRKQVDSSIFYKILLCVFAAMVLLLAFSIGISAPLVLYSYIIADVMMWTVLALWAKKTPVKPHLVFAFGWIAECIGSTVGQTVAPLLAAHLMVFLAISVMLILLAVGFAFSEGKLMLDVSEGGQANAINAFGDANRAAAHDGARASLQASAAVGLSLTGALHGTLVPDALGKTGATRRASAADGAGGAGGGNSRTDKAGEDGKASNAGRGYIDDKAGNAGNAGNAGRGCAEGKVDNADNADGGSTGDSDDTASAQDAASHLDEFASAYGLSPRECEVLALWVSGRSLKYIEGTLFISESTLKTHLRNIYRKCDTHNRDEVISLYESFGS